MLRPILLLMRLFVGVDNCHRVVGGGRMFVTPEPENYAMILVGRGVMGFAAWRGEIKRANVIPNCP